MHILIHLDKNEKKEVDRDKFCPDSKIVARRYPFFDEISGLMITTNVSPSNVSPSKETQYIIRIISLESPDIYYEQLQLAYGKTVDKTNIHLFYNCGHMFHTLCQTVKQSQKNKKFMTEFIQTDTTGIWIIQHENPEKWMSDIFLPIFCKYLDVFIEDEKDDYFTFEQKSYIDSKKYISIEPFIELINTPEEENDKEENDKEEVRYVLSNEHLSLLSKMIHRVSDDISELHSLIIKPVKHGLGITINRKKLSMEDIQFLLKYTKFSQNTTAFTDEVSAWNSNDTSYAPYCSIYDEKMTSLNNEIKKCGSIDDEYFYINQLTNKMGIFRKTHITTLVEYNPLFKFNSFKTKFIQDIIITKTYTQLTDPNLIDDLHAFIKCIENLPKTSISSTDLFIDKSANTNKEKENQEFDNNNTQKSHTLNYVKKYIDHTSETNATTVINNVSKYLEDCYPNYNKYNISRDLVDLGVSKRRKSSGIVYGIKDTSEPDDSLL